jgi:4-amino-4-deoxy-L-arabinose transferase-like glycosyltransferase
MGDFIARHKVAFIIGLILIAVYLFTRIYHLGFLPVFTDEAIYLRWAQIANQDASWRFISLTDGKQPLFIWFMMVAMRLIDDPLIAGRIISVFSGMITALGLFFLGREIFQNYRIGIIAAVLYVVYPFALVYDKMALYDSLVGTFAVWGLYGVILLVRRIRLDIALILGMVIGAGVLNKSNGFFTVYLLPFSLFLFDFKQKTYVKKLVKWAILAGISSIIGYAMYSILRLSPYFYLIDEKNTIFVYPFHEWIGHPFTYFFSNFFIGQLDWLLKYMTLPMLIVAAAAFIIDKQFLREKLLLFLWFFAPFVLLALFGKTLYPRYILFMTLSLLPLIAYTLYAAQKRIKNSWLLAIGVIAVCLLWLRTDYYLLFNFSAAPIPVSDVSQYNNDWPSGTGITESIVFFEEQAKDKKIFVATQGTFGLLPYAYELYLLDNPNISVQGFWPIGDQIPQEVLRKAAEMPTYFAFYQPCDACPGKGRAPEMWPVTPVLTIQKVAPDAVFNVYQVRRQ